MAALAYILPPVSGAIALLASDDPRVRFHGLQSVLFGAAWPALLYAAARGPLWAVQAATVAGLALWLALASATAIGRDPGLPGLRTVVYRGGDGGAKQDEP